MQPSGSRAPSASRVASRSTRSLRSRFPARSRDAPAWSGALEWRGLDSDAMNQRRIRAGALSVAFLGTLVLNAESALAADAEAPPPASESVSVTASLVTPFFGAYEAEAKIRMSDSFALLVNTSYLALEHDDWETKTGTVGAGLNYFFARRALRGWYVDAVAELMFSSWRHEPSSEVAPIVLGYTGIAGVGYQFVCDAGPVLDLAAGVVALHFPSAHIEQADGTLSSGAFTNVYPAVKVNVGWAF